jgi:hypothetical protein
MAKESQHKLLDALKAHIADLKEELDRASGHNQAVLEQRLAAAREVLTCLSTSLEAGDLRTALLNELVDSQSRLG